MGHFYTNVTLKGPTQDAIARTIAAQPRWALVSPSIGDKTVVYDRAGESQDGSIFEFAKHLSGELKCIALAVTNHDDSVLFYRLYDAGELIDNYNSVAKLLRWPAGGS